MSESLRTLLLKSPDDVKSFVTNGIRRCQECEESVEHDGKLVASTFRPKPRALLEMVRSTRQISPVETKHWNAAEEAPNAEHRRFLVAQRSGCASS